ncbi:MAG: terminase [Acidobacteria bacterium]|nr:MAG: terminase [Acidobacteriota bacterium]
MAGILKRKMLKHQIEMLNSRAVATALVTGFGGGKTETMVMKVLQQLFAYKNPTIAVAEPTIDLVKKILYPRFCEIFDDAGLVYKLNKSEGIITVQNIGTIIFISLQNDERIIGFQSMFFHLDEIDTLDADKADMVWQKALGRNRQKVEYRYPDRENAKPKNKRLPLYNTMNCYSTPEGFRFLYKKFKKNPQEGYKLIQGRTEDNPFLPRGYVDNLRASYPPELIEAYLNGQFVNLESGVVYPNYDPIKNRSFETINDAREHLHIGIDFNVNHMSAVVGVKRYGKILILEEIADIRDTPAMIDEIQNLYATGRQITVYPDASGRSAKSVDASRSDITLLRDAGFRINAPKKNPPVRNRIVNVNSMMCNALGARNLLINTDKCPTLNDNLLEQAYDKNGAPLKTGNVDHMVDALGYLITRTFGLNRPTGIVSRFRF